MKKILLIATVLLGLVQANAQVATLDENFDTFTTGTTATWPQNGWNKVQNGAGPWVYADGTGTDKHVQYYSFFSANTAGYLISPQIIAPDGSKTLTFNASLTGGSAGGAVGTIEVGLVNGVTSADMTSFVSIGSTITLTTTDTAYSFSVPTSTQQFIAFKIIGNIPHTAIQIDDVVYGSSLAVSEINANADIKFSTNADQSALQFSSKKFNVNGIQIYSANGQKVANGKIVNNTFNISSLKTGIYFLIIETTEGVTIKSKFLKK